MQKTLATRRERVFASLQGEGQSWRGVAWEVILGSGLPEHSLFQDSAKDLGKREEGVGENMVKDFRKSSGSHLGCCHGSWHGARHSS